VFEVINQDSDRVEVKRKSKPRNSDEYDVLNAPTDCIVEGEVVRLGGPLVQIWQRKYLKLFPNRLEFYNRNPDSVFVKKGVELISLLDVKEVSPEFVRMNKMEKCILLIIKNDTRVYISSTDKVLIKQWLEEILNAFKQSHEIMSNMNRKAHKMYGAEDVSHSRPGRQIDHRNSGEST
jgi:beta-adrenergic-receptor kinase